MSGPFEILAGRSAYFAPQLMGNYNGNVIGTSNLAVQNINSAPNKNIINQVKQPFSAIANSNPALLFDPEQSKGIKIAYNRNSSPIVHNNGTTVLKSFGRQSSSPCKVCC